LIHDRPRTDVGWTKHAGDGDMAQVSPDDKNWLAPCQIN
jgi:hypothetical protein